MSEVDEKTRVTTIVQKPAGEVTDGAPRSLKDRQKIAERAVKAVYIHAHMDEESFDVQRVMKCPIGVPEADGTNIPTCTYNVMYRERDARFADPAALVASPYGVLG